MHLNVNNELLNKNFKKKNSSFQSLGVINSDYRLSNIKIMRNVEF